MTIDQPLYWHQGLFLQPQHFQHTDARTAHGLARLTELLHPHAWGLISMQFNAAALATGQCQLEQLSLRFRDGTLVEYPGNAWVQARTFVSDGQSDRQTLYVGLRRLEPEVANAQVFENLDEAQGADTRYAVAADHLMLGDRLGDAPPAAIRPMRYVLRLFWEHEVAHSPHYEVLPIARLEQDQGQLSRVADFIAPSVNLGGAPALSELLLGLRDELQQRARQLASCKPTRGGQDADGEVDSGRFARVLALGVLNRYVPLLEHLLETPQVQPWALFGVMRQLVGELGMFSDECDGQGSAAAQEPLQPYRHDNLSLSFNSLLLRARQLLNGISADVEMRVRLQPNEGRWEAELPQTFFAPRHRYYLLLRGDGEGLPVLPQGSKLGASSAIEVLIRRALPGVELIALPNAPQGLPQRAGCSYLRLEPLSDAFEALQQECRVVLFMPGTALSGRAELIAVRG